jgi:hypothetical protein
VLAVLALSFLVTLEISCSKHEESNDDEQAGVGGASGDGDGDGPSESGGSRATGGRSSAGSGGSALGGATSGEGDTLSSRYPGDAGLDQDPAVLFFEDFEQGWGRWNAPQQDTATLTIHDDENLANAGSRYLQSTVTSADLEADEYISSQSSIDFEDPVLEVYLRFYAHFVGTAPTPHHWVRMSAGVLGYSGSGRANTVPPGDEGFWFDFDANTDDVFNFYVYWYKMRSGRCNDGSTTEGCEGDQGTTYHYGNSLRPPEQTAFARDEWFCIEMHSRANTVGQMDGELAFWIDDELIGDYRQGFPEGTWLRDSFHTGGCEFSACTEPAPFEGFDFRSASDVLFKGFVLDAYYERGSSQNRRAELEDKGIVVDDAQTILYDDLVIATERIGCRK